MRRPLAASLLLALAAPACEGPGPDAPDAGLRDEGRGGLTLETLSGDVQLQRADAPGAPAVAGPLQDGDTVRTGAGAGVTLRLPDGRSVEVGPEARLRVRAQADHIELELLQGVVLSRTPAAAASGAALTLRTPQGLARLGTAGEVQVAVEGGEARVEVRLGEVEFLGAAGERTRGVAGDVLRVTAGQVQVVARERRVVALAPLRVTVHAEGHGAELRRRGTAGWRALGVRDEVLEPGDGLRTRGAPARLELQDGGSSLLLEREGELSFVGAGQGDAGGAPLDEARVELHRGALALQLAPGRSGRLVLPELTVESDGGSGLQLERGAEGLTVAARAGDATLVRGAERQALRAGERAQVPRTQEGREAAPLQVEALPRAPVALVAPEGRDAVLQVFHPGLAEVALTWGGAVPPQGVQVEVATDPAFTHPVLAGRVYQPFVNVPAPARGALYWRVTGADGQALSQGSARFAPEPRRRPLAQLRNEVAEGPERTTIFYQDKPPAVTFTWAEVPGASRYQLVVYRAEALGVLVASALTPGPRAALEAGALGEGRFLWAVTPLSAAGAALRGGRMNKLELAYDNSVPMLVLTSPRPGARAGPGPVRVAGVAPVGSTLSVNGAPLSLDAKGRFESRVTPLGQPPLLLFMMSRPGAPATLTVRRLR